MKILALNTPAAARALACVCVVPLSCLADPPPPDAASATSLPPVVVTATLTPVPADAELAPTIVIDRAQIERAQAHDVADLLQTAGVEVARSGGPGQPASVFIRGGNSDYTLVLIDGVPANNDSDGGAALANMSPEMVERIELVEGPRSALYGTDAIGGVINVITRAPGPARIDAMAGGGSFGTAEAGVSARDQGSMDGNPWGISVGAHQLYSGGFPAFEGAGDSSSYRNRTLNGRAQLELGGVHLEARGWDTEGDTPYLNLEFDPTTFAFSGFQPVSESFRDQIFALQASAQPTARWHSDLTLSQAVDRLAQDQSTDYVRSVRPEADWHNVLDADRHNRLSFGARAYRERVDESSFGAPIAQNEDTDYGYVQDEARYGRNTAVAAVSYLHDGTFGERFDWSAAYGYDLTASTRLVADAGTGFHAPTADDRYPGFGGNPALQPEKALSYELGVVQHWTPWQMLDLRVFRTDERDQIVYDNAQFMVFNIGHSSSAGAQARWQYAAARWTWTLNGIWQDPRDRDTDTQLLRRARFSFDGSVARRFGRWDAGADFYASGQRQDVGGISFAPTTDGGYALVDLNAGVRLAPNLRFALRADNAFNHHYQTASGYNAAGSAVYASLRYGLDL